MSIVKNLAYLCRQSTNPAVNVIEHSLIKHHDQCLDH